MVYHVHEVYLNGWLFDRLKCMVKSILIMTVSGYCLLFSFSALK